MDLLESSGMLESLEKSLGRSSRSLSKGYTGRRRCIGLRVQGTGGSKSTCGFPKNRLPLEGFLAWKTKIIFGNV